MAGDWVVNMKSYLILIIALSCMCFSSPLVVDADDPHHQILDIDLLVNAVRWSPNGHQIAIAGTDADGDEVIEIWNAQKNNDAIELESVVTLHGHANRVYQLRWNIDGSKLASLEWGKLIIWDMESAQVQTSISIYSASMAWSPTDRDLIALGNRSIEIWNISSEEKISELFLPTSLIPQDNTWSFSQFAWSHDGDYLVSAKPEVILWSLNDGGIPSVIDCCGIGTYAIELSPNGYWLASHEGVYDIKDDKLVTSYSLFSDIAWHHGGRSIAGVFLKDLSVIDISTGEIIFQQSIDAGVLTSVQWHPVFDMLLVLDSLGKVHIWSVTV